MCINQPSIRLNKVHNISVKVYVCAQGVIYLMYWYVYFNLFQDLILRLWPWNQYVHLWSTTFNQFCPCLFSTMDCLWLDTCKQSSIALSSSPLLSLSFFPLLAFSVAVQWEVTAHSNPRWAAAHHPTAFPGFLLSCPPFPASSSGFHPTALFMTGSSMVLIHDQKKCPSSGRVRDTQAEQMQMARGSVMSVFSFHAVRSVSPFLLYLWVAMHNLIPVKYSYCVHGDMVWHPSDCTAKRCSL